MKALFPSTFIRLVSLGLQFVTIIVMGHFMPKEQFAYAMIAFALYRLIGYGLGSGLGNFLMRWACTPEHQHHQVDGARHFLWVAMAFSGGCAVLVIIMSTQVANLFSKQDLQPWLVHMAPLAVFGTLNLVVSAYLDSQARLNESVALMELAPNGLRLLLVCVSWASELPPISVAHALWVGSALPLLAKRELWGGFRPIPLEPRASRFVAYHTVAALSSLQLQGIDILIAGWLFSSSDTADYAIASRIASFFPILQQLSAKRYSSQAGRQLTAGQFAGLNELLSRHRGEAFAGIALVTGASLFLAGTAASYVGSFASSIPLLASMALLMLVRSNFAGTDILLRLYSRPSVTLTVSLASTSILLVGSLLLARFIGAYSIPLAMLAGSLIVNPGISYYFRRHGIVTYRPIHLQATLAFCAVLAAVAFALHASLGAIAAGLLLLIAVVAWFIYGKRARV